MDGFVTVSRSCMLNGYVITLVTGVVGNCARVYVTNLRRDKIALDKTYYK